MIYSYLFRVEAFPLYVFLHYFIAEYGTYVFDASLLDALVNSEWHLYLTAKCVRLCYMIITH